jgi:hypothetical protein
MEWVVRLEGQEHRVDISGYTDILTQANPQRAKEDIEMPSETLRNLILESPIAAEIEARGEIKKALSIAKSLINKGWDKKEIVETTGLDLPTVESLYTANA